MFSNYEIRTNVACWDEKWVSAPNPLEFIDFSLNVNTVVLKALHHPPFRKPPGEEGGTSYDQGYREPTTKSFFQLCPSTNFTHSRHRHEHSLLQPISALPGYYADRDRR